MTDKTLHEQVVATLSMYEAAMAPGIAGMLRDTPDMKSLSAGFADLTRTLTQHRLIDRGAKGWPVIPDRVKDLAPDIQAGISRIGYGIGAAGAEIGGASSRNPLVAGLLTTIRNAAEIIDRPAAPVATPKAAENGEAQQTPAVPKNAASLMPDTQGQIPVAIIGTAGRQSDAVRITRPLYDAMVADAETRIRQNCADKPVCAVSGGAAVSDHVAVSLFLKGTVQKLKLHLPAPFENGRFVEDPGKGAFDPGRTANYYHRQFKQKTGVDGLAQIAAAMKRLDCTVQVTPGFKERNTLVAQEGKLLIAYTFGDGSRTETVRQGDAGYASSSTAGLKDGGTADTWQKSTAISKVHVPLHLLETTRSPSVAVPADAKPMKDLKGFLVETAFRTTAHSVRNVILYVEQPDRPNQSPVRAVVWGAQRDIGSRAVLEFEDDLRRKLSPAKGSGEPIILGQNAKLEVTLKGHWRKEEFIKNDGTRAESWRLDVKSWDLGAVEPMDAGSREPAARSARGAGLER